MTFIEKPKGLPGASPSKLQRSGIASAKEGFTLVETLIVVAILAIVLSIGLPIASNFQANSQVNETASLLVENLRLAAQDSQSGWQDSGYGLKFLANEYVVYQGNDYSTRQIGKDRIVPVMAPLKIELTLSPVADDIAFNRQGLAQSVGTIKISHNNGTSKTLIINNFGVIFRP